LTWVKVSQGLAAKHEVATALMHRSPPEVGSRSAINGPDTEEAMNFRPLHDRVLLRRVEEEERSAGGVIIPDTAKEKPMQGEVMAVGPGARNAKGEIIPPDIAIGDRVLIGKWSGTEVKLDGEELLILNESDILATIETA
jgi:chaperonin GroES